MTVAFAILLLQSPAAYASLSVSLARVCLESKRGFHVRLEAKHGKT